MFVPFSCRQRCLCPSCHQKRSLLAGETIAHAICAAVPHRQLVFTIPKRLRVYCRYDRRLLGHAITTDGAFASDGTFHCLPKLDPDRLHATWRTKIFELFLAAGKIDQTTVDQMRSWPHSGFSVDNGVYLPRGDTAALRRLAEYMLRCPFSLARIVRLTDDGSVLYRAEQDHCRRFPGPASGDLRGGPRRNFQVFTALDFLAELTQHIPEKGEHLVRYYGWYSHRQRGIRARSGSGSFSDRRAAEDGETDGGGQKTCLTPSTCADGEDARPEQIPIDRSACAAQKSAAGGPRAGSVSTWAMLIRRVYEVDPLECPQCGGQMKVVSFIERGQQNVIERILRHCGLWEGPLRT